MFSFVFSVFFAVPSPISLLNSSSSSFPTSFSAANGKVSGLVPFETFRIGEDNEFDNCCTDSSPIATILSAE